MTNDKYVPMTVDLPCSASDARATFVIWVARGREAAEDDYDDVFLVPHELDENHWYLSQAERRVRRPTDGIPSVSQKNGIVSFAHTPKIKSRIFKYRVIINECPKVQAYCGGLFSVDK